MQAQISMGENFIIPLSGLATGRNEFSWHVGKEFFEGFENTEVLDAELSISVSVEKSGQYLGVDDLIEGEVTVECDRCLDDLVLPVDVEVLLSVKFGDEESADTPEEGDRELVFVPEDDAELDLGQIIYDYVCVSLPMQRHHEDGDCNPDAVSHLGMNQQPAGSDNPFAALKQMFE